MNIMFKSLLLYRRIVPQTSCSWYHSQVISKPIDNRNFQTDYLRSVIGSNDLDWNEIKSNTLTKHGTMNHKNIDAVILKVIVNDKNYSAAQSFVNYLKKSGEDLSLGVINSLLYYYFEYSKENNLSEEERNFILSTYKNLYDKYKFLDFATCEKLLHALCGIDEWQKSLKVLDDIHVSSIPSHSAYSSLIGTLFRNNKKTEAVKLIEKSINNRRPLLTCAYDEWIKYILRKYKDNKTKIKYLSEICTHISNNCVVIPEDTAEIFKNTYVSLNWEAKYTKILKYSGQCITCKSKLDCLKLSDGEFATLQKNVKDKLIIGSDLFLKTSPEELQRFLDFVESTAPYDIVLDALNIAYTGGIGSLKDRINVISFVVDHFSRQNKRILLLGRKHMLKWHKNLLAKLSRKAHMFFTDDISQDDPYFITAAILSGPQTDFLSKDLLRGHRFLLQQDELRKLFQRWQWQHQWMVFIPKKTPVIQAPLCFTPCAQQTSKGWHLPYESKIKNDLSLGQYNTGVPDCSSWLCLMPKES